MPCRATPVNSSLVRPRSSVRAQVLDSQFQQLLPAVAVSLFSGDVGLDDVAFGTCGEEDDVPAVTEQQLVPLEPLLSQFSARDVRTVGQREAAPDHGCVKRDPYSGAVASLEARLDLDMSLPKEGGEIGEHVFAILRRMDIPEMHA